MIIESQPVRVIMLSRDAAGLDAASMTATRWQLLVTHGAELEVWVLSAQETHWEAPGIRVRGIGGASFLQRAWRVLQQKPLFQPDLVTTQNPAELGWLGRRIAKRCQAKFEVQDHAGAFAPSGRIDESWNFLRGLLTSYCLKYAHSVRTVNLASLVWLTKHVRAYSYWLPIVPREDFRELTRQPIPGRVVCVARLVPVKRHDVLLQAFAQVRTQQANSQLVLVGDGPERKRLEALVEEYGLVGAVQFTGATDPRPWLASADVFALVSAHEGWGIAAVEAAMTGVPVVMTDTGCARWLEHEIGALVIRSGTVSAIADGIMKQFGKYPKRLTNVFTAAESAVLQVEHWNHVCR